MNYTLYESLFNKIDSMLEKGRVILTIEGGSASGKSTLANILKDKYDCTVIHMDDFFLRPEQRTIERYEEIGGNIDKERFFEEVVKPLRSNLDFSYQKFDCSTMSLGEKVYVKLNRLIVVEGVYSMHPYFDKYFNLSLFLDITQEYQKERILNRNSVTFANRFFEEWIPLENKYFSVEKIEERCDMTVKVGKQKIVYNYKDKK